MSRTIQTHSRTAHANTSKSITAADTRRATALSTLTSTRHSPASISQFRGFPARESTTPTCRAPGVFIEGIKDDQEDYVPGGNGPRDDDPDGNDPDGDDPGGDDPEPHDDDEEGDLIGGLRMRSAALVNRALSTDFAPLPKKLTPNTGNVRKRSLVRVRPRPALVPTPTPLVDLWASQKKASCPQATLPSPRPR